MEKNTIKSRAKPTLDEVHRESADLNLEISGADKHISSKRQRKGEPKDGAGPFGDTCVSKTDIEATSEVKNSLWKGKRKGKLSIVVKKIPDDDIGHLVEGTDHVNVNDGDLTSEQANSEHDLVKEKGRTKSRRKTGKDKQKDGPRRKYVRQKVALDYNEGMTNDNDVIGELENQEMAVDSSGIKNIVETENDDINVMLEDNGIKTEPNESILNEITDKHSDIVVHTKIKKKNVKDQKSNKLKNPKKDTAKVNKVSQQADKCKNMKKDTAKACKICNVTLPNHKDYLLHMKTHKEEGGGKPKRVRRPWPCSMCGKFFRSSVRKACHEYSKHGIPFESEFKLFSCPVEGCNYKSASKYYIEIHKKGRHSNERPHVCEYCGKGFKLPNGLATHINIHTKQKQYECKECQLTFHQKGGLNIHIKKHHMGEESWSELCDFCSEKFLHKAELCWHLFVTHGQPLPERYKVFTCDLCDYKTIRKNKLDRHMDAHQDKKPWNCNICGKKFATKSYLNRHMKYHGEKKFMCDYEGCSYASVDKIGLRKHVRLIHTHKNLKPFNCSLCNYKTALRGNLDKHIRSVHNLEVVTKHTVHMKNLKPYNCSLCNYKTALRGNLDKHIRSVHNLEVVTKHTVHMKVKFKDREAGDIITRDGTLVQSAKQRDQLENRKAKYHTPEDYSLMNDIERMSKKTVEKLAESDEVGVNNEQKNQPLGNAKREETNSPSDLTIDESVTTKQYQSEPQQQQQQSQHHQQQFAHLQYNDPNNSDHSPNQVQQYTFPVAMTTRIPLTNQTTGHPSEFYRSIEQLQMYKYQVFNPYSSECE